LHNSKIGQISLFSRIKAGQKENNCSGVKEIWPVEGIIFAAGPAGIILNGLYKKALHQLDEGPLYNLAVV
jgi:hypothetical protein